MALLWIYISVAFASIGLKLRILSSGSIGLLVRLNLSNLTASLENQSGSIFQMIVTYAVFQQRSIIFLLIIVMKLCSMQICVRVGMQTFCIDLKLLAFVLSVTSRGARVQMLEVVDTSCYFWLSCILLNVKPSRTIFQRATFSNQCTSLRKLRLYPCP